MAQLTHPFFGPIDTAKTRSWDASVALGGKPVTVELNADKFDVPAASILALPQTTQELERLDRAARAAILADALSGNDDSAAVLYVEHHHEEFAPADFERLFGASEPSEGQMEAMLGRLSLVRVGLYPEDEQRSVLFDYSIGPHDTQYLLCVSFNANRQAVAVDVES